MKTESLATYSMEAFRLYVHSGHCGAVSAYHVVIGALAGVATSPLAGNFTLSEIILSKKNTSTRFKSKT
jgi:hypothetical protein